MVYLVKYGTNQAVEAINDHELVYMASFEFDKRLDGNESVSFNAFESKNLEKLEEGSIYQVYADNQLTKLLPCTFTLQNKQIIRDGLENCEEKRLYEITAISIDEILRRKRISANYRRIRFKDLLVALIEKYRKYIPEISNDYQFIDDVDFSFLVFRKRNLFLKDYIEIIRNAGFQCFLRPDLKIQAGRRNYLTAFEVDFQDASIGGQDETLILQDSKVSLSYKDLPITNLVATGGYSETGTFTARNVITNKESIYDLLNKVNIDSNFLFEGFNSSELVGFDYINQTGVGWGKRYAIYNTPINFDKFQLWETSLQILEHKEAYVLAVGLGNEYQPSNQFAGFYFKDAVLNLIVNGDLVPTSQRLQKFLELSVTSISEDFKTVTLTSVEDLQVGDQVFVSGLNTAVTLALGIVESIAGNNVTLDRPLTEGEYNSSIRLLRVTTYEMRILIDGDGLTKFYVRDGTGDFNLLGSYPIVYPQNLFVTAFNAYENPSATVDNGVWEVGGYAIDYFFLDKASLFKAYDDTNTKLVCSTESQAEFVEVQSVINNITKNGKELGQLQFIAPAYIKLILANDNVPITASRIPLILTKDDFITKGMRVLINNEARLIDDFFRDSVNGYIDLNEPLSSVPSALTQVWIHTSIPADDTNFFIEYVPSRLLQISDYASNEALQRFGLREESIDLQEYGDIADLAERVRLALEEETSPRISGNLHFFVDTTDCKRLGYYSSNTFPTVGEYILVTDSIEGISQQTARINAITVQEMPQEGCFNVAVELSEFTKVRIVDKIISLDRGFGIIQDGDDDANYNLPQIKRDLLNITDESLSLDAFDDDGFVSGAYEHGYSGNAGFVLDATDESLNFDAFDDGEFVSGAYEHGYSGNQMYLEYNILYNGNQLVYKGRPLVYTIKL